MNVASPESSPVVLPALGESVTEGTVTQWLKGVGEPVVTGEPLLEVSTDKVDTEIESPLTGTLLEILVGTDETVEIGATLAIVGAATRAHEYSPPTGSVDALPPAPSVAAPSLPDPPSLSEPIRTYVPTPPSRLVSEHLTQVVKRLSAEKGIDPLSLAGTGAQGRVSKKDVLNAAESRSSAAPSTRALSRQTSSLEPRAGIDPTSADKSSPMSPLRRTIARRMVESLHTSAQLTSVVEADVTRLVELRRRARVGTAGAAPALTAFFAKATVDTLRAHPLLNASITGDGTGIVQHNRFDLAIAVDSEKGLYAPVIKNAGDLSLTGLASRIEDLATRTRNGRIEPDELAGGTFTLTNTGSRGTLFDTPIINQPQVAILGTGAVVRRPIVMADPQYGETIAIRSMVHLALTYDHRLVDGADAARFLTDLRRRLESAEFEL